MTDQPEAARSGGHKRVAEEALYQLLAEQSPGTAAMVGARSIVVSTVECVDERGQLVEQTTCCTLGGPLEPEEKARMLNTAALAVDREILNEARTRHRASYSWFHNEVGSLR